MIRSQQRSPSGWLSEMVLTANHGHLFEAGFDPYRKESLIAKAHPPEFRQRAADLARSKQVLVPRSQGPLHLGIVSASPDVPR